MEEETEQLAPIFSIPDELLHMILLNLRTRDIIFFGLTCRRFKEFTSTNELLWKQKFKELTPHKIVELIEKHGVDVNWYLEVEKFYYIRLHTYNMLKGMSPKYFCRIGELVLYDCRQFFLVAIDDYTLYYYIIQFLQKVIKEGNRCDIPDRRYNLTDVYYAKITVRYLMHTYLAVKWLQCERRGELHAEMVLNFFVQWIDPFKMHSEDDVHDCFRVVKERVEKKFLKSVEDRTSLKDKLANGSITEKQVLIALSQVLYQEHRIKVMEGATLDGLDIPKMYERKCGNVITIAVLYQAVARECGVRCELIAFPNHLFVEWRDPKENRRAYKVNLINGNLQLQGRCPYSRGPVSEYQYNPDGFVQHLVSVFLSSMGAIKNWQTQSVSFLLDYYSNSQCQNNPYKNFMAYLEAMHNYQRAQHINEPIQLEYMLIDHRTCIDVLSTLNKPNRFLRDPDIKKHHPNVRFAIGMIICHLKKEYVGVIRGWDIKYNPYWQKDDDIYTLEDGIHQPFYKVIAIDLSERYIAQENLKHSETPTRLYHLEEWIAKEFCDFDGICYVPNTEKHAEYPEDEAVLRAFKTQKLAQSVAKAKK